jgi:F-type H+-transporting ATPase subunit epsilon
MQVELLTPDAVLYNDEAISVSLPGIDGRFQLLNLHAAMVSTLAKGEVVIETKDNQKKTFEITGGILEILNNKAIILA